MILGMGIVQCVGSKEERTKQMKFHVLFIFVVIEMILPIAPRNYNDAMCWMGKIAREYLDECDHIFSNDPRSFCSERNGDYHRDSGYNRLSLVGETNFPYCLVVYSSLKSLS